MRHALAGVVRAIAEDPLARVGAVVLLLLVGIALFAPLVAPHAPDTVHYRSEGVRVTHDGTDWGDADVVGPESFLDVAPGADGLLAVGTSGTVARLTPDGEELESVDESLLRGVAAAGDGSMIAVGEDGIVLHHDGQDWSEARPAGDVTLHDVAMADSTALAVGADGTALLWDGDSWAALDTGVEEDLRGVALLDDSYGLVVGTSGTVLEYTEDGLAAMAGAGFRDLNAVDIRARDDALAVGERGTIMRFTGEGWQGMLSPESRSLNGVAYTGESSAWAVGNRGVALQLEGDAWTSDSTDYDRNLLSVAAADGGATAVGTNPTVNSLSPPSAQHLFGTSERGRDIFSQVIWGSRTALLVGFVAALLVVVIGTNVGLVAGYFRGRVDDAIMRLVDLMYALPFEPVALILVVLFSPSLWLIILTIGILVWRTNARVIRSQVLSISARPFVKAAKVAGASHWRIIYAHIAPNVLPLMLLQLAIATAFAILGEATLSFLGMGPPNSFSWGTILFDARLSGAWRVAWWWTLPPGIFITITILSVFFVSRALEVVANPRLRRVPGAA